MSGSDPKSSADSSSAEAKKAKMTKKRAKDPNAKEWYLCTFAELPPQRQAQVEIKFQEMLNATTPPVTICERTFTAADIIKGLDAERYHRYRDQYFASIAGEQRRIATSSTSSGPSVLSPSPSPRALGTSSSTSSTSSSFSPSPSPRADPTSSPSPFSHSPSPSPSSSPSPSPSHATSPLSTPLSIASTPATPIPASPQSSNLLSTPSTPYTPASPPTTTIGTTLTPTSSTTLPPLSSSTPTSASSPASSSSYSSSLVTPSSPTFKMGPGENTLRRGLTPASFKSMKKKGGLHKYDQTTTNLTLSRSQAPDSPMHVDLSSPTKISEWDSKNRFSSRKAAMTIASSLKSDPTLESVRKPPSIDRNEWIACYTEHFYKTAQVIFSKIAEHCTDESCSAMKAGPNYTYKFLGNAYTKPTLLPAHKYISELFIWINTELNDTTNFPVEGGTYGRLFLNVVGDIFKRLFRVYAHIYWSHLVIVQKLGIEEFLNQLFAHMTMFILEFNLVPMAEMKPLETRVSTIAKSMAAQTALLRSSATST